MTSEVLLEKQRQLKERLALAGQQVETLERLASSGHSIDKNAFNSARADFISNIPSSRALSGCKESCSLFCKCSPGLYANEKQERHALYMRYFDLRSAAQKLLNDNEQLGLMIANTKRQPFQPAKKPKPQRRKPLVAREEQLEMQL